MPCNSLVLKGYVIGTNVELLSNEQTNIHVLVIDINQRFYLL